MSYLALARKLRPQNFDEIVAQEFVVTTLKNAIELDRLVHAYLFTGPRGVGKTSTARIFAKALNCLDPQGVNPCNKCENCREITDGTSMDVIEIDGASNRGIDEIRDLREAVRFFPVKCRRKVYIIDEVHMLTEQAFNALLKTLEEPPSHVAFILATTDAQRIPATIISRCQKYDFRKIPFEQMHDSLTDVLCKEQIEYEDDALSLIIRNSDGCMRDSLSMLDQIIAFTGGKVDETNTAFLLGFSDTNLIEDLLKIILEENTAEIPAIVEEICAKGISLRFAAESLIEHTRNLLFFIATGGRNTKELTSHEEQLYRSLSAKVTEHRLFALFQVFQKLLNDLKFFSFEQYVFEFAAYKAASLSSVIPVSGTGAVQTQTPARQRTEPPKQQPAPKEPHQPHQQSETPSGDDPWKSMVRHAAKENGKVAGYLENVFLSGVAGDELRIGTTEDKKFYFQMLNRPEHLKYLSETAGRFFPGVTKVKLALENEPKKKTLTETRKEAETYHDRKTRKEAEDNELVKKLEKEFNAKVIGIEVIKFSADEETEQEADSD
ncbi:DNA polymerase III subunit gamma/tau [Geovibrio thiophilus]|uniref:DNA polymerase III subunit gamma/tau n=1 Tax=Geovibrio thiophilus TaxID=139438 RepID=A0A410JUJ0_9BACT|nr:DNA polymerase III subunit gamma/tau [Geovibrio thiophilus]QAR31852.1 DNA polymerase III subunit gamma/tau [Geovibrio thiophilus]